MPFPISGRQVGLGSASAGPVLDLSDVLTGNQQIGAAVQQVGRGIGAVGNQLTGVALQQKAKRDRENEAIDEDKAQSLALTEFKNTMAELTPRVAEMLTRQGEGANGITKEFQDISEAILKGTKLTERALLIYQKNAVAYQGRNIRVLSGYEAVENRAHLLSTAGNLLSKFVEEAMSSPGDVVTMIDIQAQGMDLIAKLPLTAEMQVSVWRDFVNDVYEVKIRNMIDRNPDSPLIDELMLHAGEWLEPAVLEDLRTVLVDRRHRADNAEFVEAASGSGGLSRKDAEADYKENVEKGSLYYQSGLNDLRAIMTKKISENTKTADAVRNDQQNRLREFMALGDVDGARKLVRTEFAPKDMAAGHKWISDRADGFQPVPNPMGVTDYLDLAARDPDAAAKVMLGDFAQNHTQSEMDTMQKVKSSLLSGTFEKSQTLAATAQKAKIFSMNLGDPKKWSPELHWQMHGLSKTLNKEVAEAAKKKGTDLNLLEVNEIVTRVYLESGLLGSNQRYAGEFDISEGASKQTATYLKVIEELSGKKLFDIDQEHPLGNVPDINFEGIQGRADTFTEKAIFKSAERGRNPLLTPPQMRQRYSDFLVYATKSRKEFPKITPSELQEQYDISLGRGTVKKFVGGN